MIYLDAAATSPVRREVLEAMWPYLTGEFGNPSSQHGPGRSAARALDEARRTVAAWLGCKPSEVVFTSGGTEADNLAIKGIALAAPRGRHLVRSAIEHPAVVESVEFLERVHGFEVTVVGVDAEGLVDPDAFEAALRPETTLATVMHANNEVGMVQPLASLAARAAALGVPFHTDAVQSAGWLDIRLDGPGMAGVTALSLSGHKLGAPKGIGVLALRRGLRIEPLVHGGGQERGLRSGTENVAFAVGLAEALRHLQPPITTLTSASTSTPTSTPTSASNSTAAPTAAPVSAGTAALRDEFIREVLERVPGAILTGPALGRRLGAAPGASAASDASGASGASAAMLAGDARGGADARLPSVASFCFPGMSGESILLQLEERGVVVSSGSACAAGSDDPSPVLLALGIAPDVAQTAVRFTLTPATTAADLHAAATALEAALADIRALAP
ncbi:cysteine desulfurase family protein [Herbiconiux liukaitaii]|uniref:cysteine desulfurase family protein n=1 Tax=Herbiconiux liukaitaii TaxID=3342799 RepID=UPI0035B9993B